MPFVATLSIWLCAQSTAGLIFVAELERSDRRSILCMYCAAQSKFSWRGKHSNLIIADANGRSSAMQLCTNAYQTQADYDLSMSIYNAQLSICAWHVGIIYVKFHKWWNIPAADERSLFVAALVLIFLTNFEAAKHATFSIHTHTTEKHLSTLFIESSVCSGLLFWQPESRNAS